MLRSARLSVLCLYLLDVGPVVQAVVLHTAPALAPTDGEKQKGRTDRRYLGRAQKRGVTVTATLVSKGKSPRRRVQLHPHPVRGHKAIG